MDFVAGAANAFGSDHLMGAGRLEGTSNASKAGAALGDAVAAVQGTGEFLGGLGGEAVGTLLDAAGITAPVGIVVNVASAAVVVDGGSAAINGFVHLAKNASENGGTATHENTAENINKMEDGKAPTGKDGHPVELHHEGQQADGELKAMTQTDHRRGGNFKKNHSNTGQQKSQINRAEFAKQRKQFWKDQAKKAK
jgi:hypothetical protein